MSNALTPLIFVLHRDILLYGPSYFISISENKVMASYNERCVGNHAYQDEKMINQIVFPVEMVINFYFRCYLNCIWIHELDGLRERHLP